MQANDVSPFLAQAVDAYSKGRYRDAYDFAEQGLVNAPNDPVLLNAAATSALACGLSERAEHCWKALISLFSNNAEAHFNLGVLYSRANRVDKAIFSYRQALQCRPDYVEAYNNLGALLQQANRPSEAEEQYRKALQIKPDYADAHYNLAVLLQALKRYDEAENCYGKVIAYNPKHLGAYNNLGVMLHEIKRWKESETFYAKALALDENYAEAYRNLGLLFQDLKRFDEAEACFRKALTHRPNFAEARWSLGMLLLSIGRFEEGWLLYEARYHPDIQARTVHPPELAYPQWRGESLAGKSIAVWSEQALGDDIQFCRFLPELKASGASCVTLVCKPALKSLLKTLQGVDRLVDRNEASALPAHDFWTLMFSIPLHLGTTVETLPAQTPYLFAKPEYLQVASASLADCSDFKIGVCWRGSALYKADADRSPGIEPFKRLFEVANARFFALMPGVREEFLSVARGKGHDLGHEIDAHTPAFEETAAIIHHLDLIISSDTSIVHLAGALGKPVWVVLPFVADWRWMADREDTPWYPQMRLFRQTDRGDWKSVFDRIAEKLGGVISGTDSMLWPILRNEPLGSLAKSASVQRTAANPLRLNLGSGGKNLDGWVNVDREAACHPDILCDLEKFPWPWPTNGVDAIMLAHVLEHLGESRETYLNVIKEIYRICKNGAVVQIQVPHPRHDHFLADPTHVRAITVEGIQMFDQSLNREWIAQGYSNTPLGLYLGVDLRVKEYRYILDPSYRMKLERGELSIEQITELLRTHNNICQQINFSLVVVKE